jgi:hypothetical protein
MYSLAFSPLRATVRTIPQIPALYRQSGWFYIVGSDDLQNTET